MSTIQDDLLYTRSHEWVRVANGTATVGITDHAQAEMKSLSFVELPEAGQEVSAGEACAVVESSKAAQDTFSPVSGEITSINEQLEEDPENINRDPYGEGWIFAVKLSDPSELEELLTPEAYRELCAAEEA